jgi:peptide/nickel transport system ATP-binding protein
MADDVAVMYLGRVVELAPVVDIFERPGHPYTAELLRSVPSVLAEPRTRLATIAGAIPHPYQRPAGCPFHPRCPVAVPGRCDRVVPADVTGPTGSRVACLLAEAAA